jgi:3-oxoadipate enol-lactonase/4-carboxymuconolactone decarboxylase
LQEREKDAVKFARIGNVTLHYQLHGLPADKPVVVFSNSLGTDLRIWDGVIEQLRPHFTILAYDKRGHGLSTATPAPYSIADHADDLAGLLDHVGVKSAVICGLSVGGIIAQALYARRPDLVSGLILCDTAPKVGTAETWNARIEAIRRNGLASITDAVMERWFTAAFRSLDNPAYAGYRAMFERQPVEGYCGTCDALREADLTAAAGRIKVPVLCVVGDQDLSTPAELVKAMADAIPGADYVEIAGSGHIPCVEQPDRLASLVIGFGARVAALSGPPASRLETGMAVRRQVLGDAHVDRAEASKTDLDLPFQTLITEMAWGSVWSRPGWSKRERSMVTIALLAALGHDEEVAMHVRATANTGASRSDITEAMLHVAVYAGVPAANHAIKIVKQVFDEMDRNAIS